MSTENKTGKLVIVRHHESEWNKLGKWTGITDVSLTPHGHKKSEEMGALINDFCFDQAFTSKQIRTYETLSSMMKTCMVGQELPIEEAAALNERDYGDYTGKNKWEMQEILGKEEFDKLRREWNHPVPNGETLKMVYERAVPFYKERILPLLLQGKNVLIVSHGNTIRALMKYIENIPDEAMVKVEMLFGAILIYDVDNEGHMVHKEIRHVESKVNA